MAGALAWNPPLSNARSARVAERSVHAGQHLERPRGLARLGAGQQAVADLGITTIAAALRPLVTDVTVLDGLDGEAPNIRFTMTPAPAAEGDK